ncbi:hypothetical protein ACQFX6_11570 [Streptomyces sp. DSM 41987]|uniref:hypothetical protein n=1 Tax=Streptomyces TaxID=1883 RepID=UPI003605E7E3
MSLLAFLPFVIAWHRKIIGWRAPAAYAALSATVLGFAIVQPKVNAWFAVAVWTFMITTVVHVLLLDRSKQQIK